MKMKTMEVEGSREEIESFAEMFIRRPDQQDRESIKNNITESKIFPVDISAEQKKFISVISEQPSKRFKLCDVGEITGRSSRGSQWSFVRTLEKIGAVKSLRRGKGNRPSIFELA